MRYSKCLIPLVIIVLVLLLKQCHSDKQNPHQNLENFQANNLAPTTIDNRTVSILQQKGTDGNALFLGSIDQRKKNYALFLEILPSPNINGKMQIGISMPKVGSLKYFHEVIFGETPFKNITIHTNEQNKTLDLYLVKEEGKSYTEAIPLTITCSGNLNSSEIINLNKSGTSVMESKDVPTADIRVSTPITTKITNALKNAGIRIVNNKVHLDVEQIKIGSKWTLKKYTNPTSHGNSEDNLGFFWNTNGKPNLRVVPTGSIVVKTEGDHGGNHLRNTLHWCTHTKGYKC